MPASPSIKPPSTPPLELQLQHAPAAAKRPGVATSSHAVPRAAGEIKTGVQISQIQQQMQQEQQPAFQDPADASMWKDMHTALLEFDALQLQLIQQQQESNDNFQQRSSRRAGRPPARHTAFFRALRQVLTQIAAEPAGPAQHMRLLAAHAWFVGHRPRACPADPSLAAALAASLSISSGPPGSTPAATAEAGAGNTPKAAQAHAPAEEHSSSVQEPPSAACSREHSQRQRLHGRSGSRDARDRQWHVRHAHGAAAGQDEDSSSSNSSSSNSSSSTSSSPQSTPGASPGGAATHTATAAAATSTAGQNLGAQVAICASSTGNSWLAGCWHGGPSYSCSGGSSSSGSSGRQDAAADVPGLIPLGCLPSSRFMAPGAPALSAGGHTSSGMASTISNSCSGGGSSSRQQHSALHGSNGSSGSSSGGCTGAGRLGGAADWWAAAARQHAVDEDVVRDLHLFARQQARLEGDTSRRQELAAVTAAAAAAAQAVRQAGDRSSGAGTGGWLLLHVDSQHQPSQVTAALVPSLASGAVQATTAAGDRAGAGVSPCSYGSPELVVPDRVKAARQQHFQQGQAECVVLQQQLGLPSSRLSRALLPMPEVPYLAAISQLPKTAAGTGAAAGNTKKKAKTTKQNKAGKMKTTTKKS